MKKFYNQDAIISQVADKAGVYKNSVRMIFRALEEVIVKDMSQAIPPYERVDLRLMNGLVLRADYLPEREGVDPRTGEEITVAASIKPKAVFTPAFKDYINQTE